MTAPKPTPRQLAAMHEIRRQLLRDNIRAAFLQAKHRAITERLEAINKGRAVA